MIQSKNGYKMNTNNILLSDVECFKFKFHENK